jgi:hypothetical protein
MMLLIAHFVDKLMGPDVGMGRMGLALIALIAPIAIITLIAIITQVQASQNPQ